MQLTCAYTCGAAKATQKLLFLAIISAWGQSLAPSKQHKLLSAFGTCGHDDHVKPLTYRPSVLIHVQWHRPSQDTMSHVPTGVFLQPLTISVLTVAGTHGGDEKITLHGLKLQVAQGELLGICGEVRHAIFLASFCDIVLYAFKVHQDLSCLIRPHF